MRNKASDAKLFDMCEIVYLFFLFFQKASARAHAANRSFLGCAEAADTTNCSILGRVEAADNTNCRVEAAHVENYRIWSSSRLTEVGPHPELADTVSYSIWSVFSSLRILQISLVLAGAVNYSTDFSEGCRYCKSQHLELM